MSEKFSKTTADLIPWNEAINVIRELFDDGNYVLSAYIAIGIFTGLRASELRRLNWTDMLDHGTIITVIENRTHKKHEIKLNNELQELLRDCYKRMNVEDKNMPIFLSQKKGIYTTQRINVLLKKVRDKYHLHCYHISNHSLRKTFGRRIFDKASELGCQDIALIKLCEFFGHANTQVTRRYLGIPIR